MGYVYDFPNARGVNLQVTGKIKQYQKDMHQGDYTCEKDA